MAKSISAEELQLKKRARRRLIGAIALVTVVAVFLPMILDHEPKAPRQDINIQIPSSDSGTFTSKIVPVVPGSPASKPPAKSSSEGPKPVPVAKPESAKSRGAEATPPAWDTEAAPPAKPAPEAVAKPTVRPAQPPASPSLPPAPAASTGFVVQVAALNDGDKAKQMQEQMLAAGIKSYTETVPTQKGTVTRVRAGPFASRDEAEKIRDQLKGMGLSGNLVPR